MEFLKLANGWPMFILCLLVILIVVAQPIIMTIMAQKRGLALGLTNQEMYKVVKSTTLFSIIPSIPIVVSYLILVPAFGKYFPWLRLSVVGSAMYETTVANMGANAFGFDNIYNTDFPLPAFVSILLIISVGIIGGNVFNILFLKKYDQGVKKLMAKNAALIPAITGGIFVALYGVFAAPIVTNVQNLVGIFTFLFAGGIALLMNFLAKTYPKLKEHAFSISLLSGMMFACLISLVIA